MPDDVVAAVANTKANGGRVIAIGTTSVRSLESAAKVHGGRFDTSSVIPIYLFIRVINLM